MIDVNLQRASEQERVGGNNGRRKRELLTSPYTGIHHHPNHPSGSERETKTPDHRWTFFTQLYPSPSRRSVSAAVPCGKVGFRRGWGRRGEKWWDNKRSKTEEQQKKHALEDPGLRPPSRQMKSTLSFANGQLEPLTHNLQTTVVGQFEVVDASHHAG